MNLFDFWSVISFMGIAQALLLLVLFTFDKRKYFLPNLFLILLILWIVWLQIEFLVIRRAFVIQPVFFFGSRHGVWFLLGPLVYHYIMHIFHGREGFRVKDGIHYLPFLVFVLILPLTGNINISERVIDYGMLSVLKFPMLANSWLDTLYGYIFILQFVHASIYLLLSLRAIRRIQKESMTSSSDNRLYILSYLKAFVVTMIGAMVLAVIFIGVLLNSQWYVRELDYVYILPLTVCIYFFSYYAMRLPDLFESKPVLSARPAKSGLENEGLKKQYNDLRVLIKDQKLYQNPELRLTDLSTLSGVSYHQLSEVINKEAGVSFFEFINQFRVDAVVEAFKNKNLQNERINILEIAFSSGFNNKVSFNRYFKKQTGHTPTDFIKNSLKRG